MTVGSAAVILAKTSWRESVSATVMAWPLTVKVPAVTAVAVCIEARVTPATLLLEARPLEMPAAPCREAAVASCCTATL